MAGLDPTVKELFNQCDQIWRNFATLAKFKVITFLRVHFIGVCQTFEPTLAFFVLLVKFLF